MEAERDSHYKAIRYVKGEALEPLSKEVFAVLLIYSIVILLCVYIVSRVHNIKFYY